MVAEAKIILAVQSARSTSLGIATPHTLRALGGDLYDGTTWKFTVINYDDAHHVARCGLGVWEQAGLFGIYEAPARIATMCRRFGRHGSTN